MQKFLPWIYILSGYLLWGFSPFFFTFSRYLNVAEILTYRIIFSLILIIAVFLFFKNWKTITIFFKIPRAYFIFVTALMIGTNWGGFLYGIAHGYTLDMSIAYYLYPTVTIVLALWILKEKINFLQILSILLMTLGVGYLIVENNGIPWYVISVPVSFSIYSLLHKFIPYNSLDKLFLEMVILLFLAIVAIPVMALFNLPITRLPWQINLLDYGFHLASGGMSILPLILFVAGANSIKLTTISILQYTTPTIILINAIVFLSEPLMNYHIVVFSFIWSGIILYIFSVKKRTSAS